MPLFAYTEPILSVARFSFASHKTYIYRQLWCETEKLSAKHNRFHLSIRRLIICLKFNNGYIIKMLLDFNWKVFMEFLLQILLED